MKEWRNWEGRFRSRPKRWYEPTSVEEVVAIVRAASAAEPIKVVGAGHSWSDIALTHEHIVSLERMANIREVNHELHQVTVDAGISIDALNTKLAALGMGLSNQGSVNAQSIAGAISTGTHGTGAGFGNMATQIIDLEMVTASGEVFRASATENPDLFDAARVGLGSLGIITGVTIQCEPAFSLHSLERPVPFATLVEDIQQYASEAEHCKLWWFPHTKHVHLWQFNRVSADQLPGKWKRWSWWIKDDLMGQRVSEIVLWVTSFFPAIIPVLNRILRAIHYKRAERTDRSDRIFNLPVHMRHPEMEYAIPIEHAAEVLQRLQAMIADKKFRVNFVIEVRFVKGDGIWLSPAYQRDACYIGVMMYRQERAFPDYFKACEELFLSYEGRPHWGKIHYLNAEQLDALYPKYKEFSALRNKLDPERIFCNEYLDRVFPKDA